MGNIDLDFSFMDIPEKPKNKAQKGPLESDCGNINQEMKKLINEAKKANMEPIESNTCRQDHLLSKMQYDNERAKKVYKKYQENIKECETFRSEMLIWLKNNENRNPVNEVLLVKLREALLIIGDLTNDRIFKSEVHHCIDHKIPKELWCSDEYFPYS